MTALNGRYALCHPSRIMGTTDRLALAQGWAASAPENHYCEVARCTFDQQCPPCEDHYGPDDPPPLLVPTNERISLIQAYEAMAHDTGHWTGQDSMVGSWDPDELDGYIIQPLVWRGPELAVSP